MEPETQNDLETLSGLVRSSGLTPATFQSLVLDLGPQEARLFHRLLSGPCDTVGLRNGCSIGNPSDVATRLNRKLETAGDPRRVVCSLIPHVNQFGNRGQLGEWRLLDLDPANEGAS